MLKLIKWFKRKLFNLFYLIWYKISFKLKISIYSFEETLTQLVDKEKSLVRISDGDIRLFAKKSISYQVFDDQLVYEIKEIILNYKVNDKYLLAINPSFEGRFSKQTRFFWYQYFFQNRVSFFRYFNNGFSYYDASVVWPSAIFEDYYSLEKIYQKFRSIWTEKNIVVIEGEFTRNGVGNDLFQNASSVRRIIGPSKNGYEKINEIVLFIQSIPQVDLILISFGPAAKPLSMNLININYRVIDFGHFDSYYEMFLNKSDKLLFNTHKHTAGLTDSSDYTELIELKDDSYFNQIIKRFV